MSAHIDPMGYPNRRRPWNSVPSLRRRRGTSDRYMHCPDCGKRGVTSRIFSDGDGWECRYCNWSCYAWVQLDDFNAKDREALRQSNPGNPNIPMPDPTSEED